MPRPIKWSRDLHAIHERAQRSTTEEWDRLNIEDLFNVGRDRAQSLMKAIAGVQSIGSAHFVSRAALLEFLDEAEKHAEQLDEWLRARLLDAPPPPRRRRLRVAIPAELRSAMIEDLPPEIRIAPGELVIKRSGDGSMLTGTEILELLGVLARVCQNDLARVLQAWEPPASPPRASDDEIQAFLTHIRQQAAAD